MTPQELRKSLLLSAFKGKITSQRKEESSVLLLSKIQKSGFGNKKYHSYADNLSPYDIPSNWSWCMFHQVVSLENGQKINGKKMPYLEAKYLRGSCEPKYEESGEFIEPGTKVVLVDGENSGEVFITSENGYLGSTFKVLNINSVVCEKYVLLFMKLHQDDYRNNKKGAAIPHLNKNIFFEMPFPIPPLEEQERIVAKIEGLMPLVDRYEEAWNRLELFNKKFPAEFERSLLFSAVQGKIVEQNKNEGTGKDILEKLKRKPVDDDVEKPFDIPDSWVWCRLDDVTSKKIKRGKSPKYITNSGVAVFAQKCNTKYGTIDLSLAKYLDEATLSKYDDEEFMVDGDIVLNSTGNGTLGRIGMYHDADNPSLLRVVPDSHVTVLRISKSINLMYAYYYLKYCQQDLEKLGEGSTNQTELAPKVVSSILFPLPPLEEQNRIVKKLQELLPLCKKLVK